MKHLYIRTKHNKVIGPFRDEEEMTKMMANYPGSVPISEMMKRRMDRTKLEFIREYRRQIY